MMSKWPETCFIVFLVPKPFILMGHMMKFDDFLFFIIFGYNLATSGYIWLQVAIFGYNDVEMTWNLFHRVSRPKAIHFDGSYDENRSFSIFHQFRAVLGPLGPIPGKPDFSGKIRLCNFSSNIIPKLLAGFQKHPTSRFPELWKLTTTSLLLNLKLLFGL